MDLIHLVFWDMQISPDMFPDHGSKKKCFLKEDEGGIKEGRKEGRRWGRNERGCSPGCSKITHTSHFLFSIISFKPDNSESNLSEHVGVCVGMCVGTLFVYVHVC